MAELPQQDWLLAQHLLGPEIPRIPLTLFANGAMITGTPVPPQEWQHLTNALLIGELEATPTDPALIAQLRLTSEARERNTALNFDLRRERAHEEQAKLPVDELWTADDQRATREWLPQVIHLVDVTILWPGGMTSTIKAWRGRLSEVVGWTYGGPSTGQ